jgi:hypothetical protein
MINNNNNKFVFSQILDISAAAASGCQLEFLIEIHLLKCLLSFISLHG